MPGPHEGGPTFPPPPTGPDLPTDTWPRTDAPDNPSDNPSDNPAPDNTDTGTTNPTDTNTDFEQRIRDALAALASQTTTKHVNPEVAQASAVYLKLWGVAPPPGYIEGLVRGGLNLYEIVSNEVAKPAYSSTKSYKDSWAGYAAQIADVFGRR